MEITIRRERKEDHVIFETRIRLSLAEAGMYHDDLHARTVLAQVRAWLADPEATLVELGNRRARLLELINF